MTTGRINQISTGATATRRATPERAAAPACLINRSGVHRRRAHAVLAANAPRPAEKGELGGRAASTGTPLSVSVCQDSVSSRHRARYDRC